MAYTAYDWQQTLIEKADYAESRLQKGSPVVALGCDEGILLFSLRRQQGKLFEIYDRLALGALGNPSDLEAVRQFAIDFSHAEGFQRSAEDVSIQRVVGFAVSPVLKRAFSDPRRMPVVLKAVFAQVGERPADDLMFVLGYDGEFQQRRRWALIAGDAEAEARMQAALERGRGRGDGGAVPALGEVLALAVRAWAAGQWRPEARAEGEAAAPPTDEQAESVLREALAGGAEPEAVLLERDTARERRYRALPATELAACLPDDAGATP